MAEATDPQDHPARRQVDPLDVLPTQQADLLPAEVSARCPGGYDSPMTDRIENIRQRLSAADPLIVDAAMGLGLTAIVCGQIWLVTHVQVPPNAIPPGPHSFAPRSDFGVLPYLIAACAFLPLAMRRSVPWLALVFSGIAAAIYQVLPFPPAFTVLGPMIALYSLAAYAKKRTTALMALLVAGIFVSVPAFAFSFGVRWVAEVVGSFMLLAAAALLGDTTRSRRQYVAEVEARAEEAERTREEEALRRVDEERMRIAREVHDVVAHSLSIVTVQAAAAEAVFDTDPAQARESIGHIRATSRQALGELRSMLDVLRTGDAESPLAPAADLTQLERLVAGVREAGLAVDLTTEGEPCDGPCVRLGLRLSDRAGVAHQRGTARARHIGGRARRRAPAGTGDRGARQWARRRPQRRPQRPRDTGHA